MIHISWITELIDSIPKLLDSVMFGYTMLFIYRWISFKDKDNYRYTLIVSVILNYIITLLYAWISNIECFSFVYNNRILACLVLAFFVGLILGLIARSDSYSELLRDLHISRDSVDNIWDTAIKNGTWLRIYTKDPNISYLGYVVKSEPFQRNPHIILGGYQILDINGNVLADYRDSPNEQVILSTDSFDRVEITYTSQSICLYRRLKQKIKDFLN
jgi:hypothetical protein